MMLLEIERLASSNAKLREIVEELNSVMAESKAILFEQLANTPTSNVNMAAKQAAYDPRG